MPRSSGSTGACRSRGAVFCCRGHGSVTHNQRPPANPGRFTPILVDAAYDAPLWDLRANWLPVGSPVLVGVGLTAAAVAITARQLFPDMPWPAAVGRSDEKRLTAAQHRSHHA